jgi:hypothetical protein
MLIQMMIFGQPTGWNTCSAGRHPSPGCDQHGRSIFGRYMNSMSAPRMIRIYRLPYRCSEFRLSIHGFAHDSEMSELCDARHGGSMMRIRSTYRVPTKQKTLMLNRVWKIGIDSD